MADLRNIRRRIGSINNVQKLSEAMKMVSTAKFWKYNSELDKAKSFVKDVAVVTGRAARLLEKKTPERILELVLTSDKGMCGGFNATLLKTVNTDSHLFVIGKRGNEHFRDRSGKISRDTKFWDEFSPLQVSNLYDRVWDICLNSSYDGIAVNYMSFHSFISQKPSRNIIYPVYPEVTGEKFPVEIEPDPEIFFSHMAHIYGKALLKQTVIESLVSENAARMSAMDNASRNASELIDKLKITYNKLRQDAITVELMEIIGGTEALND